MRYPGSLHNHTDYSNFRLRDSVNTIPSLIDEAIKLGHKVIAITEHETVASAIAAEEYYEKIKVENPDFKVIRGNEIYLCRNGLKKDNFVEGIDKFYHFILLAKDEEGHKQIRELSNRAWMRGFEYKRIMRVPTYYNDLIEIVGKNPGHVIGSTACIGGALPTMILKARTSPEINDKIKDWCELMVEVFGENNFYLELQPSNSLDQIYVNEKLVEISEELGIPFIVTNDAHYLNKNDREMHKAFLNSQNGDREVDEFYATTYLMDTEELESFMTIKKEKLEEAYKNIEKIKNMCKDYSLKKPLKIPRLKWKDNEVSELEIDEWCKRVPMFKTFLESPHEEDNRLVKVIIGEVKKNSTLQNKEAYEEINYCLEDVWKSSEVNGSRWSAYFLNLQNIIDICWEAGSLVGAGRGSGVGFLLLYILGITQINPLREKSRMTRWRFLNPSRVSVLDVDLDIEGHLRDTVLQALSKAYGSDRVAQVLTLGTEKSKSAILTAARGLGIDVDEARYLASMIESDRGQLRTLSQTFYGDEEKDIKPNATFVQEMTNHYPELWKTAQRIEGLICRVGVHAGGVIFVDEPFTNSCALMRAANDQIITQFDLHDAEKVGLIKYDILSIKALDNIHQCLDLLIDYGYIEKGKTLRETYENTIGVYKLERDNPEMWEMIWEHKIQSLFQMEKQSGIQGIALTKPKSVDDLATLNSVIRLMAQEKGAEQPLNKYARFKQNIRLWYEEMDSYGLTDEEQKLLEPILLISSGICEAQEKFMELVQIPECGGFDLEFADRLRKSIAKKNPAEFDQIEKEYYETVREKKLSRNLCNYVWQVCVKTSRGYGFKYELNPFMVTYRIKNRLNCGKLLKL